MDTVDTDRRRSVKIHLALLGSLALYGLLFAQIRARASASRVPRIDLFLPMLFSGLLQLAVLWVIARRCLRSPVGQPAARARLYFLFRAASAEVFALLGLLIGLRGAPIVESLALFAMSLAAMLVSFPTGEAWQNALRLAESRDP